MKTEQTYSFRADPTTTGEKLADITSFCLSNGVRCSEGLVLRTLIERAELGPDLLGMVRARKEAEQAAKRSRKEIDVAPLRKRPRPSGRR